MEVYCQWRTYTYLPFISIILFNTHVPSFHLLRRLSKLSPYFQKARYVMKLKIISLDTSIMHIARVFFFFGWAVHIARVLINMEFWILLQRFNTQISPFRFLHLKCLTISLSIYRGGFSPSNDYLSLAYFLDASPVLEIFTLTVSISFFMFFLLFDTIKFWCGKKYLLIRCL